MTLFFVAAVVFSAAFLQSLSGFGFALLVMPVITLILGLRIAAPLIALAGLSLYGTNLVRYRKAIDSRELLRLGAACALGVPVGIWALVYVDEAIIRRLLGLILVVYAVYSLARPMAPRLCSRWWAYPAGFAAGCLGGAYNTPGPPVIVYGSLRQWPKEKFRAELQALFFVNAVLVVASHTLAHHVTAEVLSHALYTLPALLLGVLASSRIDRKLDRRHFRALVTVLVLGLLLALGLGQ
jgi:uncharacterized membrane protein YfcA